MSRQRSRRGPLLRQLLRDWTELAALELQPGRTYIVSLNLARVATARELERMTGVLAELLDQLRDDDIRVKAVIMQPGEQLQVFALDTDKKPTKPAPRRRRTKGSHHAQKETDDV